MEMRMLFVIFQFLETKMMFTESWINSFTSGRSLKSMTKIRTTNFYTDGGEEKLNFSRRGMFFNTKGSFIL